RSSTSASSRYTRATAASGSPSAIASYCAALSISSCRLVRNLARASTPAILLASTARGPRHANSRRPDLARRATAPPQPLDRLGPVDGVLRSGAKQLVHRALWCRGRDRRRGLDVRDHELERDHAGGDADRAI